MRYLSLKGERETRLPADQHANVVASTKRVKMRWLGEVAENWPRYCRPNPLFCCRRKSWSSFRNRNLAGLGAGGMFHEFLRSFLHMCEGACVYE